jgi:hypothetical protein
MPRQPNGVNRVGGFSGAMGVAGEESPEVAPGVADMLTGEVLGRRVTILAIRLKK